ncbi:MAG: helix-turn-helix transcriptional regulator [Polyangiales bacterium]
MKAKLKHLSSQETWSTAEAPAANVEVIRLEGEGGEYELHLEHRHDTADPFKTLSPRQRETAKLAALGMTTHAIAKELGVGNETVRSHIKTIYRKLGVETRAELARVAVGDLVLLPE